jgi:hypothetical protein
MVSPAAHAHVFESTTEAKALGLSCLEFRLRDAGPKSAVLDLGAQGLARKRV